LRNGVPLTEDPKLKVESKKSIHILSLDNAALADSALFTLIAKNESGEASESFSLIVQSNFFYFYFFIKPINTNIKNLKPFQLLLNH